MATDGGDLELEQRVQLCLRVLEGKSDEHKFAGLLMVAKLTDLSPARLQLVRRQVLAAVGARFFLRLLHTRGADADGAHDALSSFQTLGLNLIASFCSDAEIAEQFADDKLVLFLLGVLETPSSTAQAQNDSLAILDGVARTAKGRRLLLGGTVLEHMIDALKALRDAASSAETDRAADDDTATATLTAFWSLIGHLAAGSEFWTKLPPTVVEFVCSVFERAGGAESTAVLAVLNQYMALVADNKVSFAVLSPHLDRVRQGVLRFLRAKWPHQERDECLKLVEELMKRAGTEWMLAPGSDGSVGALSAGKFVLVVLKLVSIEIKLMLDDLELALVQMEEKPKVEHVEETERQERQVQRVLQMLPVCFAIVEMIIGALVACLGEDDDDSETASAASVPIDVLLELKQSFGQVFGVVLEFLTLAREYMKTHRYRALRESGAASVFQLDAVVFASVRVVGAWIAEDSDSCMAQLVDLVPFLVLYEPLVSGSSPSDAAAAAPRSLAREPVDSDDEELDSDDELDEAGTSSLGAAAGVDQLHFLLPGLLQISATAEGAAALTEDATVLRRLLRFCCALCGSVGDDAGGASGLPTLTLSLGVLVNLLLEKDGAALCETRHAGEWRRALAFLLPLACASGSALRNDAMLTADERGEDDRFVMLLHALCVVLLIAGAVTSSRGGGDGRSPPSPQLVKLLAPFDATLAWVARHPPSVESGAAADLFELVRILTLRQGCKVTQETLRC